MASEVEKLESQLARALAQSGAVFGLRGELVIAESLRPVFQVLSSAVLRLNAKCERLEADVSELRSRIFSEPS